MPTYELILDDSAKAQLLLELLKGMDLVKQLKQKGVDVFTTEGEPLQQDLVLEMITIAEGDLASDNTFTSAQVRKMLGK